MCPNSKGKRAEKVDKRRQKRYTVKREKNLKEERKMQLLYWFEAHRTPLMDTFMSLITHLGSETLFMVIAIAVFWCVSKRHGYYLLSVGFIGTLVNQALKLLFHIPRPWVLDSDFTIVESARADATGFSFPSGHTQSVVGTMGGVARFTKHLWLRIVCIVIAALVAVSRMYLGVHTPRDVGVSLVIAVILVLVLYPIVEKAARDPKAMGRLLLVMVALSIIYLLYFTLVWTIPAGVDMGDNLAHGIENGWKMLGCTVGMTLVWWLDEKFLHFDTEAVWYAQILKVVIGLGLLLAVKSGLKPPLVAFLGAGVGGAVRYFLMVLVAGAVWPLTFRFFGRMGHKR